jgi:integrase
VPRRRVPEITSHSLRGHATLATERGSTGQAVAAALGHTSFAVTTSRHYVAPGVVERAAQRRVGEILEGRVAPQPAPTPTATPAADQEWAGW